MCISRVWTAKSYIDYHVAFSPILLGYSYQPLVKRVNDAIKSCDLFGVGMTEFEIELAKELWLFRHFNGQLGEIKWVRKDRDHER